jgi:hypothetical protein
LEGGGGVARGIRGHQERQVGAVGPPHQRIGTKPKPSRRAA